MLTVLKVNKQNNRIIDYTCTDGITTSNISKQMLETYIRAGKVSNARIQNQNTRSYIRITSLPTKKQKYTNATHLLMNKDTVVAEVNYLTGVTNAINKLPYGYIDIQTWVEKRLKFSCARDTRQFFAALGLNNNLDLIEITHCISVNDTFWLKSKDSDIIWNNVSPFRNNYSEIVSTYALEGYIHGLRDNNYFSPDIATDGSFPHTWKFNNGHIQFIKAGSKYTLGGTNSGREPFSEYYASIIAQHLNFNTVKYDLRTHIRKDGRTEEVTVCDCFTSEQVGSVSAATLGLNSYEEVIDFCAKLSEESLKTCLDMFFLDCLLLNTDRHFHNIEFLFDTTTLKILSIAPIYDNNYSMLPRFIEGYDKFCRGYYIARDNRTFEDLYNLVKSRRSYVKELQSLSTLRLKAPKRVNISPARLKFLNIFLQTQVKYLQLL